MIDLNVYNLPTGTEVGYGRNLYILGTSDDGPLMEPTKIVNLEQAYRIFGREGNLARSWYEAYQVAGASINIFLVKISGSPSRSGIYGDFEEGPPREMITFQSKNAGQKYNNMRVYVHEDYIEVLDVNENNFILRQSAYPSLGKMVQKINDLTREGKLNMWASTKYPTEDMTRIWQYYNNMGLDDLEIDFEDGADDIDIDKNELYRCLSMTYDVLEGQPIDIIIAADANFDDVYSADFYGNNKGYGSAFYTADRDYLTLDHAEDPSKTATFHGQIIEFCYRQLNSSIMTHAIMPFSQIDNIEDVLEENAYLTKAIFATCFKDRFDLITKSGDEIMDHGRFVSVTAGEFEYVDEFNIPYYNNSYIGYAAMVCMELTPKSTTNKVIPNIKNIRYHMSDYEANNLSRLGVTTFRYSVMKDAIVVFNGVTAERESSPYHTLSNTRMVQTVITYCKKLLDDYIGEDVARLKLTQVIDQSLEKLVDDLRKTGIIKDMKYALDISDSGYAVLNLDILAIYSLEYVNAVGETKL